jgi:hypothetical protein
VSEFEIRRALPRAIRAGRLVIGAGAGRHAFLVGAAWKRRRRRTLEPSLRAGVAAPAFRVNACVVLEKRTRLR